MSKTKARFGRDIYCQECGKDDQIEGVWVGKFIYHYVCKRCNVVVKEIDRSKEQKIGGQKSDR